MNCKISLPFTQFSNFFPLRIVYLSQLKIQLMKNILLLICICALSFSLPLANQKVELGTVKLKDQTVELTLTSDQKFYVGGNIHILHIGKSKFKLSKLDSETGKKITFLIPQSEFNALVDGSEFWMSYGEKIKPRPVENIDTKKLCEASPNTCWYIGTFNKSILK